ncbi:hypothetical protein [Pseudonocardia sp. NPDC049154]|uniref:hypothetical protein n=1 Tax=Pseudonocardia sp. NPDC049154 TaxID=3155501 RepID=UPI0033EB3727
MTATGALGTEGRAGRSYFHEEQNFPLWIKAIPLLTATVLGAAMGRVWLMGPPPLSRVGLVISAPLALLFVVHVPLVVLHFQTKLVVAVDSGGLRIRVYPLRWNMLPSRMTQKDVALSNIVHWKVSSYNSLTDTEFWGWHFWGLSAAKNGRFLYIMRPSGPVTARGVELQVASGEKLIIGSKRPAELVDFITRLKGADS